MLLGVIKYKTKFFKNKIEKLPFKLCVLCLQVKCKENKSTKTTNLKNCYKRSKK